MGDDLQSSDEEIKRRRIREYWNDQFRLGLFQTATRYHDVPFIPAFAGFGSHKGQFVLELGVGTGVDHSWLRKETEAVGVGLTLSELRTTQQKLKRQGTEGLLVCADGAHLPFKSGIFDFIYSFGVIHHSAVPSELVDEIHRTAKINSQVKVMIYHRPSLVALRKYMIAILKGRWRKSINDVLSEVLESPGTRTYTIAEARVLFRRFKTVEMHSKLVYYDIGFVPPIFLQRLLNPLGFFLLISATK